jgi:hypothetical protein
MVVAHHDTVFEGLLVQSELPWQPTSHSTRILSIISFRAFGRNTPLCVCLFAARSRLRHEHREFWELSHSMPLTPVHSHCFFPWKKSVPHIHHVCPQALRLVVPSRRFFLIRHVIAGLCLTSSISSRFENSALDIALSRNTKSTSIGGRRTSWVSANLSGVRASDASPSANSIREASVAKGRK